MNVTKRRRVSAQRRRPGQRPGELRQRRVCDLNTSTTTTFTNPITLNGIGGTVDGYAKPAIYGDGSGGAYTLSGQITLAATSDVGNYYGNGMLTLGGKITGPGGLVLGKTAPTLADEYGPITLVGTTSNDYSGGTTINRGTVYLQKTRRGHRHPRQRDHRHVGHRRSRATPT